MIIINQTPLPADIATHIMPSWMFRSRLAFDALQTLMLLKCKTRGSCCFIIT